MTVTALVPRTSFTDQQIELIKQHIAKGATDQELALFLNRCERTGLDPFSRQIHFVKRQGEGTIQVGIDGYRLIADRTGLYAGNDDPVYGAPNKEGKPTTATVTVWKIVAGQRCAFTATARWAEYAPPEKQDFMWRKMPFLMLGKVAESLALRKAFPAELSGLYTHEEMAQAGGSLIEAETYQPADTPKGDVVRPLPPMAQRDKPVASVVADDMVRQRLIADYADVCLKAQAAGIEPDTRDVLAATDDELRESGRRLANLTRAARKAGWPALYQQAAALGLTAPDADGRPMVEMLRESHADNAEGNVKAAADMVGAMVADAMGRDVPPDELED